MSELNFTETNLDDVVQPFQIETTGLRGRLVRLGGMLDEILNRHAYPDPVAHMLGETVVLAGILASGLKYDGVFTLQTKGNGAISLMVADVTSDGGVRGYARYDASKLPADGSRDVRTLLGEGYLAFTVDQGEHTERYQGIVELAGDNLAECVTHYFRQSEQIKAGIKLAVGRRGGRWRAGGLMLQRLPDQEAIVPASDQEDNWRRAMILMDSATEAEFLDPGLAPNGLLFRLFHEDGVRVYSPAELRADCRCSRDRVTNALAAIPRDQIEELLVDGAVEVACEFCNTRYRFGEEDLDRLYVRH
ncbi:MAG TPA: Hsp33 family molecular chaperone HslO [Alphaproteobacteria bacterium]|nr:Hsp33 family molecular chaperone HslO [Alphaproteobacteria bacterium]